MATILVAAAAVLFCGGTLASWLRGGARRDWRPWDSRLGRAAAAPLLVLNIAAYFTPWGAISAADIGYEKGRSLCYHEWCARPATQRLEYSGSFAASVPSCDEHVGEAPGEITRPIGPEGHHVPVPPVLAWGLLLVHGGVSLVCVPGAIGSVVWAPPPDAAREGWRTLLVLNSLGLFAHPLAWLLFLGMRSAQPWEF